MPNLRPLANRGIVEKDGDSTRGGRRAYYRLRDRDALGRALDDLRYPR